MGHDVTPILKHKLDTSSIKSLAEDICSRIDINIEYGYWAERVHFDLLGENPKKEAVVLGTIIKDKKYPTFDLSDHSYMLKQLYHKYGEKLFYIPEFWGYHDKKIPDQKVIDYYKYELIWPSYSLQLEEGDDYKYLSVYKDMIRLNMAYYSRWWYFCRFFLENKLLDELSLVYFQEYRKENMRYTLAFGGDVIYYLDDQSDVLEGVGMGSEWDMTWPDFKQHVHEKTGTLLLEIPKFLTDSQYRMDFLAKKEYPLAFIDDFSDIM